ncbi:histidinol-phosphatase [Demequina sp. NBRC 110056]|uniref:histidinol-phosphatase n=1 Tax=Demequina sp. NBRC 110056 TaxID=1570345 RepID=UPI000A00FB95|nr:histidinol-phosphatase [Demequina sp. NBRC 110056]
MQPTGPYAEDLALAMTIADQADALTLANFASDDLTVELKADDTPVTAVDRETELLIRRLLDEHRPADAFHGEEFADKSGGSRQWVVDPIDGTKNYIRGVPVWATLIALVDDGRPVVGVVSAPALGQRWFAAAGDGAWKGFSTADARAVSVSDVAEVGGASLSYSSLTGWEERGLLDAFLDLSRTVWRTRAYGDFWSYVLVAEGVVDAACEPELELYDMAALVPVVEEAGGTFTSLAGEPGPFGGDALATNGRLHPALLEALRAR